MALLDAYERKARLTPGLFAVLPIACTVTTLGLGRFPVIAGLVGLLTAAGGAWLLSTLVGDVGRKIQQPMFERWGGPPTTMALRTREATDNPIQRDVWRAAVEACSGIELLAFDDEASSPAEADARIAAATAQILHLGHDMGVPSVVNENTAFGYQRNVYGFRHIGRAIAGTSALVQAGAAFHAEGVSRSACTVGAFVSTGFLFLWLLLPSETRMRGAAERYSRQLLIAAHNHARTSP